MSKKKITIIICTAVIIIFCAVTAILFIPKSDAKAITEMLSTAQKYLVETDYERAIAEFNKVIEIDPMNTEAYLGLAEAYEKNGQRDKAIETLEKGYEATGDARIKSMLELLTGSEESEETEAVTTAPVSETETERITTTAETVSETEMTTIETTDTVLTVSETAEESIAKPVAATTDAKVETTFTTEVTTVPETASFTAASVVTTVPITTSESVTTTVPVTTENVAATVVTTAESNDLVLSVFQNEISLYEGESEEIAITALGSHALQYSNKDDYIAKAVWQKPWEKDTIHLKIYGENAGKTRIKVYMSNDPSIYQYIRVYVIAVETEIATTAATATPTYTYYTPSTNQTQTSESGYDDFGTFTTVTSNYFDDEIEEIEIEIEEPEEPDYM